MHLFPWQSWPLVVFGWQLITSFLTSNCYTGTSCWQSNLPLQGAAAFCLRRQAAKECFPKHFWQTWVKRQVLFAHPDFLLYLKQIGLFSGVFEAFPCSRSQFGSKDARGCSAASAGSVLPKAKGTTKKVRRIKGFAMAAFKPSSRLECSPERTYRYACFLTSNSYPRTKDQVGLFPEAARRPAMDEPRM